jgi:hypothetical protein
LDIAKPAMTAPRPQGFCRTFNTLLLVTVALANKLARFAWAIMTTGELYRRESPPIG